MLNKSKGFMRKASQQRNNGISSMATEYRRNQTRWRTIGGLFFLFACYGVINGQILPGFFGMLGGASLLPIVNRYIIYVPVPVGVTLILLGILMGGGHP